MMIEKLNREQTAAIYAAWLVLTNPHANGRRENPDAFAAGRKWASDHSFDAVVALIEFSIWIAVINKDDAIFDEGFDYFCSANGR
jgi:hypothetical protein